VSALKTLRGPRGWRIVLDSREVFPADPGAGTPAMVYSPSGLSGTYWCVADTGEIDGTDPVPGEVARWIDSVADEVNEFVEAHS
jgi:hypothetical protein